MAKGDGVTLVGVTHFLGISWAYVACIPGKSDSVSELEGKLDGCWLSVCHKYAEGEAQTLLSNLLKQLFFSLETVLSVPPKQGPIHFLSCFDGRLYRPVTQLVAELI